jgi:alkylated DNA repair protein alkB family protein 1
MGGQTVDEKPSAFWLRSGDVVSMAGESRRCFHGVPRVHSVGRSMHMELEEGETVEGWEEVRTFVEGKRVNVNVRQVFGGDEAVGCGAD